MQKFGKQHKILQISKSIIERIQRVLNYSYIIIDMNFLSKLKEDKIFAITFLLIIFLGLFIRLYEYDQVGLWNDDVSTIPSGLLWFYPHSYFPGLSGHSEPPVGNILIGAGCMLSGEDFSKVSEIKPTFYPGREELIGQELSNAGLWCHSSIYLFGILFLIAIFLLFLWRFYNSEKNSKKEFYFLILSAIFLALASATKFSIGIFIFFTMIMISDKYKSELKSLIKKFLEVLKLDLANKISNGIDCKRLVLIMFGFLTTFIIAFLTPFKFSIKNAYNVYYKYTTFTGPKFAEIGFNINIFKTLLHSTIVNINIIESILFLFSIFIFLKMMFSNKNKKDKFIFYATCLSLISMILFSQALEFERIFVPYLIPIIFLISLAFSEEKYSIFNVFKITRKKLFFYFFIIIYLIYSVFIGISSSPYFEAINPLFCHFEEDGCIVPLSQYSSRAVADYLSKTLKDDETFLMSGVSEGVIYYYIRQEQSFSIWSFDELARRNLNRDPTFEEKIEFFHPGNQIVRYIILNPNPSIRRNYADKFLIDLKENFEPNHKIKLNNRDAAWIYDLQSLRNK